MHYDYYYFLGISGDPRCGKHTNDIRIGHTLTLLMEQAKQKS